MVWSLFHERHGVRHFHVELGFSGRLHCGLSGKHWMLIVDLFETSKHAHMFVVGLLNVAIDAAQGMSNLLISFRNVGRRASFLIYLLSNNHLAVHSSSTTKFAEAEVAMDFEV